MTTITINEEPKGKARPRFTKGGHVYTPQATMDYEQEIAWEYKAKHGEFFDKGTAVKITIAAYYKIPNAANKTKRMQMLNCVIRPQKKPDVDNIAKIVLDALNGVAYHDDAQVVDLQVHKFYSIKSRITVIIESIEEETE